MMLAVVGGGMFLFATSYHVAQLFLAFLTLRTSFAVDTASDACLTQWFQRLRGRALSFVLLCNCLCQAVVAITTQHWVSSFGWRAAWVYAGGDVLHGGAACDGAGEASAGGCGAETRRRPT